MSKKSPQQKGGKKAAAPGLTLRHWLKRLAILLLKLALVSLLVATFYLVYLDSKISKKFAGQKWQVPAQIYARSLELFPGKTISQQQLIAQLDRLQYQRDPALSAPGQYSVSRNHVSIYRRPFTYIDGYEAAQLFSVEFNRSGINRVMQRQQKEALNFARLEPQLIDHLVAAQQEDRELVQLQQVPELFKDALLLVEDREFYHHHGVSPLSVIRALWVNLAAGRTVQGGSTLTPQLAIVSSMAHFFPFTRAEAYGASKAAVSYFADSLRLDLADSGISVHLIEPGFVDTPLTQKNDFAMPFLVTVEQAAERQVNVLYLYDIQEVAKPADLLNF